MEPGLHPMAEHSLDALCRNTKFTRRQIQLMYRSFKQVGAAADPPAAPTVSVQMECPTGFVEEDTFKHIFAQFFPYGNACSYARYVFKSFDRNRNGAISFKKMDVNRDGVVTMDEFMQMCSKRLQLLFSVQVGAQQGLEVSRGLLLPLGMLPLLVRRLHRGLQTPRRSSCSLDAASASSTNNQTRHGSTMMEPEIRAAAAMTDSIKLLSDSGLSCSVLKHPSVGFMRSQGPCSPLVPSVDSNHLLQTRSGSFTNRDTKVKHLTLTISAPRCITSSFPLPPENRICLM
ncbi:hypothetical protein IscW_ISCW005276 [Ixodes scapularis]|uniref:EF-hand domain-containing protein n=1 Tax=Ixodes scapularis TaxID=6945 RepID=B7PPZ3_IXOSC|nr:hypothetical protein IscW_ISCW005276 [Ixodes scapularis]|eukprot:XP_002435835.1 hypothetical protein IscW_ISCW005276 [Ixodes scapularis]